MPTKDAASSALAHVRKGLSLDREWSLDEARGFTWWGHRLAQRVWIGPPIPLPTDERTWPLYVETDLLRGPGDTKTAGKVLDAMNGDAILSAPVWDAPSRTWRLSSWVRIGDDNLGWAQNLAQYVAGLQLGEAEWAADRLAKATGLEVAATGHPENGPRPEPDELVDAVATHCRVRGMGMPGWTHAEGLLMGLTALVDRGAEVANEGDAVLFALPGEKGGEPGDGGVLVLDPSAEHPLLGPGLRLFLHPPRVAEPPWELNRRERAARRPLPLLGSWGRVEAGTVFSSFLFNAARDISDLSFTFVMATAARAWAPWEVEGEAAEGG